jgi:hypothetical protein
LNGSGDDVNVPVTDTGWGAGPFNPGVFPPIQNWLPGALEQAAASGSPVSTNFNVAAQVPSSNNQLTYGTVTLYYSGTVTVSPSGGVGVSGTLSGFDIYDFNVGAGRPVGAEIGTAVGLAGGFVDTMLTPGMPPATPYTINLTPVPVNFGIVGK